MKGRAAKKRTVCMRMAISLLSVLSIVVVSACSTAPKVPAYQPTVMEPMGAVSPPSVPPMYRINYGDSLAVRFLYHGELNTQPRVRPDGQMTVPGLGDFYVAGMTTNEVERDILRRASITHRNPVVSVLIKEYTTHVVYVGGQVRKPGFVEVRPGLTTLRAVYERGGFTRVARLDSVIHIAWNEDGEYSAEKVNLEGVLQSGLTAEDVVLGPNDVVYVPTTWVADAGIWVEQWLIDLIPVREPNTGFANWDPPR